MRLGSKASALYVFVSLDDQIIFWTVQSTSEDFAHTRAPTLPTPCEDFIDAFFNLAVELEKLQKRLLKLTECHRCAYWPRFDVGPHV
jgi:hypothetical protein